MLGNVSNFEDGMVAHYMFAVSFLQKKNVFIISKIYKTDWSDINLLFREIKSVFFPKCCAFLLIGSEISIFLTFKVLYPLTFKNKMYLKTICLKEKSPKIAK